MVNTAACTESRLEELIDTYDKLIFSICYKLTGDYFISEDLMQETFLAAFQKYDTFDGANEKAWICRIATNKSIDYLRSASSRSVPTGVSGGNLPGGGNHGTTKEAVRGIKAAL